MAGTDKTKPDLSATRDARPRPAIVLVEPQLGENIGTAARAMANFGVADLRIVRPRDGWPNPRAEAAASGASVVAGVRVFDDERAAVADCPRVYATTARPRELTKPVYTPEHAAREMRALAEEGVRSAVLFGGERAGLTNDQISLADVIVSAPVNPGFASLNLAQAVLLVCYEWFKLEAEAPSEHTPMPQTELASREALFALFDHVEGELDEAHFFFPPEKRPHMVRAIRTILTRARLTDQDVRILRGVIKGLVTGPRRKDK